MARIKTKSRKNERKKMGFMGFIKEEWKFISTLFVVLLFITLFIMGTFITQNNLQEFCKEHGYDGVINKNCYRQTDDTYLVREIINIKGKTYWYIKNEK